MSHSVISMKNKELPKQMNKFFSESKKPKLLLTNWKTIKGGTKTKLLSEQIDLVLYG